MVPENDPPVLEPQSLTVDEDGVIVGTLSAYDPEGGLVTFSLGCPPRFGTIEFLDPIEEGTIPFRYTPFPEVSGTDSFVFLGSDGSAVGSGLVRSKAFAFPCPRFVFLAELISLGKQNPDIM